MGQQNNWDLKPKDIERWIEKEFDSDTIVYAEKFGKFLVRERLTTSQIRNLFGEVKRIQGSLQSTENLNSIKKDFLMLRPKLAYAAKRAGSRGIDELRKVLDHSIKTVKLDQDNKEHTRKQFENFVDFFEAILAYHKAAGGRD